MLGMLKLGTSELDIIQSNERSFLWGWSMTTSTVAHRRLHRLGRVDPFACDKPAADDLDPA
jgi:hypothetical protein